MFSNFLLFLAKAFGTSVKKNGVDSAINKIFNRSGKNLSECFARALESFGNEKKMKALSEQIFRSKDWIQLSVNDAPSEIKELYEVFIDEIKKSDRAFREFQIIAEQHDATKLAKILESHRKQVEIIADISKNVAKMAGNASLPADVRLIDENTAVRMLPAHLASRQQSMQEIIPAVKSCRLVLLYGMKLTGKSTCLHLLAKHFNKDGIQVVCVDLQYGTNTDVISLISNDQFSHTLFLIDNLDTHLDNTYAIQIIRHIMLSNDDNYYVIAGTERPDETSFGFSLEGILTYEVKGLDDDDIREIATSYGMPPDCTLLPLIFIRGRHPIILHYLCKYCERNHWQVSQESLLAIFTYQGKDISEKVARLIDNEVRDEGTKQLLARLLLVGAYISDNQTKVLANTEHPISGYEGLYL